MGELTTLNKKTKRTKKKTKFETCAHQCWYSSLRKETRRCDPLRRKRTSIYFIMFPHSAQREGKKLGGDAATVRVNRAEREVLGRSGRFSCRRRALPPPPLLLPLPPVRFWVGRYIAGDFYPVQLQLAVHCFAWCSFRQFRAVRPAARTNKIHPRECFPALYSNCRLILASDYITTL